jgi:carbonic anhydrase
MDLVSTLKQRNEEFAGSAFASELKMLPSMRTVIVGCVDPRVDPADIFKLQPGKPS